MAIDVLVVDDEQDIRELISGILEDEGYSPRTAGDSDSVFRALTSRVPALVILDIWLQGSRLDGLEILEELKKLHPSLPILIISGHGNIETAVAAIKRGAYDFIEKPFNSDKLLLTVQRALETARLRRENTHLRSRTSELGLIGKSTLMTQLRSLIERIADSRSRVLICGPDGSGKEIIARTIHAQSNRADLPFVVAGSASISPEKMEEELFGIEGSDGKPAKVGLMEEAHGGTLLFDEIGDMPLETQGKVLRVLVDQRFTRVGGHSPVEVDVRIVTTTAKDLLAEAENGKFRSDLYHRLNVVSITAPSLAARREDIQQLAEYFISAISRQGGIQKRTLSQEALAALQAYHWPGNVRQLRNVIEQTLILMGRGGEAEITVDKLPLDIVNSGPSLPTSDNLQQIIALPLREAREKFEREYLLAQINRFGGNISRTASFICMERSALHRKLKALGITPHVRPDTPAQ
ncbi:sigma-54-dependent transcriptional regulator [Aquisalinus flavus]|uniref:Sigma-54-dependent Fis family transcriptional regulator n=1 Tax=Aquisalinus flavus TaxID=1526572 RepID=A0A8J2V6E2_9PROT|nr:sigma-54 dependent transcriptional regulator [Aquisalinus flavus]MBD0427758.1 sigma-54-dependent Fis family transcriptional regulator [Aquisalinus flavus]UNE47532.1 sigma-54-dependent Fis family transcriptional regulator [Aquisalinus flavus]GGD03596.1 sigma-54-dependent Fis family transcriptional regulator [Aquisalinus flavus]